MVIDNDLPRLRAALAIALSPTTRMGDITSVKWLH